MALLPVNVWSWGSSVFIFITVFYVYPSVKGATVLEEDLSVGVQVGVQVATSRAGAEVSLGLHDGERCSTTITLTGAREEDGTIYWQKGDKATGPRLLWTSFRSGENLTVYLHRRTADYLELWLDQTPQQTLALQSPHCPSTGATLRLEGRGAELKVVQQAARHLDYSSLAVGEQVLVTGPDGALHSAGLCSNKSCGALRLHGVGAGLGLAYTTLHTFGPSSDGPGKLLQQRGPWQFDSSSRTTLVLHRRTEGLLTMWLQSDPLRVISLPVKHDWDRLHFHNQEDVLVHYDNDVVPPVTIPAAPSKTTHLTTVRTTSAERTTAGRTAVPTTAGSTTGGATTARPSAGPTSRPPDRPSGGTPQPATTPRTSTAAHLGASLSVTALFATVVLHSFTNAS